MAAAGRPGQPVATLRERLLLAQAIAEVLIRRSISIECAARLLSVNEDVFDRLIHGCIGGFDPNDLERFRRSMERAEDHGSGRFTIIQEKIDG